MNRRSLTGPELNLRVAEKALEVAAIASRARAQGKGPHREIGHVQRTILYLLKAKRELSPVEIAAACSARGEIECLDTGRWRLTEAARKRRAA